MWRGRSVDGVAPDPYLKLKRGTNIWNDVSNNEWDRITVARSGSTRERREESGARSIDRSIDSFELEHEATTRNRAEGGFLDRDWFCFSLSIGHINHIANDAALLFIYSLSLVLRFFLPDLGISRLRPSSVFRRKSAATPSSAGSSLSFDHAMPRRRPSFVEMKSVNNMFHVQFFIIPSFQRFQSLR